MDKGLSARYSNFIHILKSIKYGILTSEDPIKRLEDICMYKASLGSANFCFEGTSAFLKIILYIFLTHCPSNGNSRISLKIGI